MSRGSWKSGAGILMAAAALLLAAACRRQTGTGARQPTPGGIFVTVPPMPTPIPIPGRLTHTPVPPR